MPEDPFRLLITGSRSWQDVAEVRCALYVVREIAAESGRPLVVVHGACPDGGDGIASQWVREHGRDGAVSEEPHPARWPLCGATCPDRPHRRQNRAGREYCPLAGFRRNTEMVALGAHLCLAFVRAGSVGATHCADAAERAGIPTRRWPFE